jgi:hypothetical protein
MPIEPVLYSNLSILPAAELHNNTPSFAQTSNPTAITPATKPVRARLPATAAPKFFVGDAVLDAVVVGVEVEVEVVVALSGVMTLSRMWITPLLVRTLGEMSLASLK